MNIYAKDTPLWGSSSENWHPITTGVKVGQIAKINVSHHDRLYRGMVPPPHYRPNCKSLRFRAGLKRTLTKRETIVWGLSARATPHDFPNTKQTWLKYYK